MSWKRNVRLLTWFNFLLDLRLYAPVAIIYFAKVSGSYTLGMGVFSVTMLSSALFEVPTGVYSDMIGRKKTLMWGAVASLLSVIFYALGVSYVFLLIGAVLEGLARALYSGNNDALLHDTLTESGNNKEYANYLGRTGSMFQWALAISAVLGGMIASVSFSLVMWLSVIPAVFGLLLACLMVEPKVSKDPVGNVFSHLSKAVKLFIAKGNLRLLSLSSIIGYAQGESSYQFQSAFISSLWPLWAVGLARMLSNVGAAVGYLFSGKLIRRFKALPVLLFGKVYSLAANIIGLAWPTTFSPLLLSSTSFFFGARVVSRSTLMQREYTPSQRSTMESLNSLFGSLAFAVVSLFLGLYADMVGPAKALLSMQLLAVVSTYLIWRLFKNSKK